MSRLKLHTRVDTFWEDNSSLDELVHCKLEPFDPTFRGKTGWFTYCVCGWISPMFDTRKAAETCHDHHVFTVTESVQ